MKRKNGSAGASRRTPRRGEKTGAAHKVPQYVRLVDGFPLTISGKIQKYLIREQLRAELNLAVEKHA